MPALIDWYNEDEAILIIRLESPLTWDEYHQMIDRLEFEAVHHVGRFDVINIPTARPPIGNPIPHFQRLEKVVAKHQHLGLYVTVSPAHSSVIVRTLSSLFKMRGMAMSKGEFAPSIEAARERIIKHRESVHPAS